MIRWSALLLLLSLPASADPDANSNGMSDPWEKHFHNGELFSPENPAHDPAADPDGDGYDNLAESLFGTDPFSAESPHGRPGITIVRHPELDHLFLIRWESVPGVKYQLHGSPDLGASGWLPVDDPVLGTGQPIVQVVEIQDFGAAPAWFWRLSASTHDTDGDNLSDAAEHLLGSSPYLADTAGYGQSDLARYLAGQNPSGDSTDSDGDGVPDNVWYSVVFEVAQENLAMPAGVGFPGLDGGDPEHRYLTRETIQEYSVNGSPRYATVSGGEYIVTATYLDGSDITADGQPVTSDEGQTFNQWKDQNGISLDQGESLEWDPQEIDVEGPTRSADEEETITTTTRGWRVKKDGDTVRSGTETIETIHRILLDDRVTWQEFWDDHVTARPWEEEWWGPTESGPLGGIGYDRAHYGDAMAAEAARDRFRYGSFNVSGTLSLPGVAPHSNLGSDTRLKSLRWRWVRFDPDDPFAYHYEAPPAGYRRTFRFLLEQRDYLASLSAPGGAPPLVNDTWLKGVVALECAGGQSGWQEVPLSLFDEHRIDKPAYHQDLDFGKRGSSQVSFINLPADLAADANRDGEIAFGDRDRTTVEKPFRFWINNDQDDVETDEPSVVETPDFQDRQTVGTLRDLEDLCRLSLRTGLDLTRLRDGDIRIGLQFRDVAAGNPSIRVWPNQSTAAGNADYLTTLVGASMQTGKEAFGVVSASDIAVIPPAFWQTRTEASVHLVFEGVGKGIGELVATLHDRNGAKIGEAGDGVWLHLLDVREMYQRARIVNEPEDIPHPWENPNPPAQTWVWDPWGLPYVEDPRAENITAIFVHGWRLTYATSLNWADTSYKRLWHQGFKGKFYAFRWATFSGDNNNLPDDFDDWLETDPYDPVIPTPPPGVTTYNPSEYRAWLCGTALAGFVNQLPNPDRRSLFAHSMGNVIAGSALRSGMEVQLYAMCNAAMSAMAYDPNPVLRDVDNIFLPTFPHVAVDTDPDPAIRDGYGLENKFNLATMPEVFNFGLPDDQSLGRWSLNNWLLKPHKGLLVTYSYKLSPPAGAYKLNCSYGMSDRQVTTLPEAMGFVTKSLTRTAGADLRTRGCIGEEEVIDMKDWFGEVHSAQWRWNNQKTHIFWQELFERLRLKEIVQ